MQEVKASAEGVSDALKLHGSDSDGGLLYTDLPIADNSLTRSFMNC